MRILSTMAGTALFRSVRLATNAATPWMNGFSAALSTGLAVGALLALGLALGGAYFLSHPHGHVGLVPGDWRAVGRVCTAWLAHVSLLHLMNNTAAIGAVGVALTAIAMPRRVTDPRAWDWLVTCARVSALAVATVIVCALTTSMVILLVHPAGYEIVGASATILALAGVGMVDLVVVGRLRNDPRWLLAAVVMALFMGWAMTDVTLVLGEQAGLRSLANDPVDRYGHLMGWVTGGSLSALHWLAARPGSWWDRRRLVMPPR